MGDNGGAATVVDSTREVPFSSMSILATHRSNYVDESNHGRTREQEKMACNFCFFVAFSDIERTFLGIDEGENVAKRGKLI